jgi:hypothetical protein
MSRVHDVGMPSRLVCAALRGSQSVGYPLGFHCSMQNTAEHQCVVAWISAPKIVFPRRLGTVPKGGTPDGSLSHSLVERKIRLGEIYLPCGS